MASSAKPLIRIVTPGTPAANNGNWRTAARWAAMLRGAYRVILQTRWEGEPADALIGLHARRSAPAIAGFHERFPQHGLGLVLTGTDLYRDLPADAQALTSLRVAHRIVVLQEDAVRYVPREQRRKVDVIFQSAAILRPALKARGRVNAIVVGHLRDEKDPATVLRAVEALPRELPIRVLHVGAALDASLGRAARRFAERDTRYRWVDALPHGLTRAAIKRAHVLVHPSRFEGGANVIVEAINAGTPLIASEMSGNIGMLGPRYPGLFPVGDADALAAMLARCATEAGFLARLWRACAARRPLFQPRREAAAVRSFVGRLVA